MDTHLDIMEVQFQLWTETNKQTNKGLIKTKRNNM